MATTTLQFRGGPWDEFSCVLPLMDLRIKGDERRLLRIPAGEHLEAALRWNTAYFIRDDGRESSDDYCYYRCGTENCVANPRGGTTITLEYVRKPKQDWEYKLEAQKQG